MRNDDGDVGLVAAMFDLAATGVFLLFRFRIRRDHIDVVPRATATHDVEHAAGKFLRVVDGAAISLPGARNSALTPLARDLGVVMLGVDHALDLAFPKWGPRIATLIAGAVAVTEIRADAVNMSVGASFCGTGQGGPWKPLPDGEPGAVTARSR